MYTFRLAASEHQHLRWLLDVYPGSFVIKKALPYHSLFVCTVLNQLPLPSPLLGTTTKSLLYSGCVAEEVGHLMGCRDETLVSQLASGLSQVSMEHM